MVIFSIVYPNQNYFKEYCQIILAFSTLLENYVDFIKHGFLCLGLGNIPETQFYDIWG